MRLLGLLVVTVLLEASEGTLVVTTGVDPLRALRPTVVSAQWVGLPLPRRERLEWSLEDRSGVLDAGGIDLPVGDAAAWGMSWVVVPQRPPTGPATLTSRWAGVTTQTAVATLGQRVPDDAFRARLVQEARLGDASLGDLARAEAGFPTWHGVVDPVDGTAKAVRWVPRPQADRTVILLRQDPAQDPGSGARWAELPASWRSAADAARVEVIEVFPGGDPGFTGPALRRVASAAALAPRSDTLVMAVAPVGAVAVPFPLAVVQSNELADSSVWRMVGQPAPVAAPSALPWADGPVTVVVGTGEHVAAQRANRVLADALQAAWWAWARGDLPRQEDTVPPPAMGHLICIGSPRSHRLLTELELPVTWDHRLIQAQGRVWHRSHQPSVAIALPRPGVPGAWILVFDGAWRWPALPWTEAPPAVSGVPPWQP